MARKGLKVQNLTHVRKRLKVKPHPDFGLGSRGSEKFDLSGLSEELRKAIEGKLK